MIRPTRLSRFARTSSVALSAVALAFGLAIAACAIAPNLG